MYPKQYLQKFAAAIVKRSGIARPTVEALLPHVFDQIRYEMTEGSLCCPVEGFGTFAVIDKPERQRRYTYKGKNEIHVIPPKKVLKFTPTKNLKREVDAQKFDPARRSFWHHPDDPKIRRRCDMKYNPRNQVFLEHVSSTPEET